jgi:predicted lipoprotein with Yx(FWY)xxD motif
MDLIPERPTPLPSVPPPVTRQVKNENPIPTEQLWSVLGPIQQQAVSRCSRACAGNWPKARARGAA